MTLRTFSWAAFVAVGVVSAAFAFLRRRRDSLLIYFSLFAAFYGLRLWIWSRLLGMTVQGSTFYSRLRPAVNYIILIPAFLFFIALGLPRRLERAVGYAMVGIGAALAAATFLFGDSGIYERINSTSVIAASCFFLIRFMVGRSAERGSSKAADFAVIRWGLLIFVAFVVWQNLAELFPCSLPLLEPSGLPRLSPLWAMLLHVGLCAGSTVPGNSKRTGGRSSYSVIHSADTISHFNGLPSGRPLCARDFGGRRSLRLRHC